MVLRCFVGINEKEIEIEKENSHNFPLHSGERSYR